MKGCETCNLWDKALHAASTRTSSVSSSARTFSHRLLADGGAVAGVEGDAVDFDRAFGRHQIAVARFAERVFGSVARL
jgi:hypothetical protein